MRRAGQIFVVIALLASACTGGGEKSSPSKASTETSKEEKVDTGDLTEWIAEAGSTAPEEPRAAARWLVRKVFEAPSDSAAAGPLGELLRRSGFPLVTMDGDTVGLPDDAGFVDLPIYIELLRGLAHSVRARSALPFVEFSSTLTSFDLTSPDVSWTALAFLLANWDKTEDSPAFARTAASAIRALAAERGEPIDPLGADEQQWVDPVQAILIAAHLGVEADERLRGATLQNAMAAESLCAQLDKAFNKQEGEIKQLQEGVKKRVEGGISKSWEVIEEAAKNGKLTALEKKMFESFKIAGKRAELVGLIIPWIGAALLLNGLRITVSGKQSTHYKHADGDTSTHVKVTARVTFDSGLDKRTVDCFNLAGADIPADGDMAGALVQWSLDQPLRPSGAGPVSGAHLLPTLRQSSQITPQLVGTTVTDGTTTWELKPPVENKPGVGEEHIGTATVLATVQKNTDDWNVEDLWKALDDDAWKSTLEFLDAAKDLPLRKLLEVSVNAVLPTARHVVAIKYHGAEPVVIKGSTGPLVNIGFWTDFASVDLVSCDGRDGPYRGTAIFGKVTLWALGTVGQGIGRAFGVNIPDGGGPFANEVSLIPGPADNPNVTNLMNWEPSPLLGKIVLDPPEVAWQTITPLYDSAKRIGTPIGEFTFILPGPEFNLLMKNLSFPVYAVKTDPRCSDMNFHWDSL